TGVQTCALPICERFTGAKARSKQREEGGGDGSVEAKHPRIRDGLGRQRADEGAGVPAREQGGAGSPEGKAPEARIVPGDRHRRGLVEHELGRERTAPPSSLKQRGEPQAVEGVTRSEQDRSERAW